MSSHSLVYADFHLDLEIESLLLQLSYMSRTSSYEQLYMILLVKDIWFLHIRSEVCFPDFWKPLNSLVLMQAIREENNVIVRQKQQLQQELICLGRKPIWSNFIFFDIIFSLGYMYILVCNFVSCQHVMTLMST